MKKVISWILFILTVIIFVFDMYITIAGTIDVKNKIEMLVEMGRGGMEYMAVGADILLVGVVLISVVGSILAIVCWKTAQNRVIRIISVTLYLLFVLPIFFFFCIYLL